MLYRIFYSANKERRKTEEQRLEKFGSAVIPIGTIGCYFVDFDVAEEIAEELNEAHKEDGVEYEVIIAKKLTENDVDKELLIYTFDDYDKFCERKYNHLKETENKLSL